MPTRDRAVRVSNGSVASGVEGNDKTQRGVGGGGGWVRFEIVYCTSIVIRHLLLLVLPDPAHRLV